MLINSVFTTRQTIFRTSEGNIEMAVIQDDLFFPPIGSIVKLYTPDENIFTIQSFETVVDPIAKSVRVFITITPAGD